MDIVEFAKMGQRALRAKLGSDYKKHMRELSKKAAEKRSAEAKKRKEESDSILPIDTSAGR